MMFDTTSTQKISGDAVKTTRQNISAQVPGPYDRACPTCRFYVLGMVLTQVRPLLFQVNALNLPVCTNATVQRLWIAANIPTEDQTRCFEEIPLPLNANFAGPVCRSRFWQDLIVESSGQKARTGGERE